MAYRGGEIQHVVLWDITGANLETLLGRERRPLPKHAVLRSLKRHGTRNVSFEATSSAQIDIQLCHSNFDSTASAPIFDSSPPSATLTSLARIAPVVLFRRGGWVDGILWQTDADSNSLGQRSQDPPNLLQGQGLQEAHPAQGHPLVILVRTPHATHTEIV
jgi:hypothetical protein